MTTKELVESVKNKEFNLKKELKVKKYLPIMEKKKLAIGVIAECTDDLDDFITVDRFKASICLDMYILAAYTNLEVTYDFNEMIAEYDTLCEKGLLKKIIEFFEDDYVEVCKIFEGELHGLLVQNSIDAQVVKIANKINNVIDTVGEVIGNIDLNDILPDGMDISKLMDLGGLLK